METNFSTACMAAFAFGIAIASAAEGTPDRSIQPNDWPTKEWQIASPEHHGIDTNALAQAIRQLPKTCPEVHSLIVVRHGRLIVERYFHGRGEHDYWNIKSASKSLLSALVGIALQEGHLHSLDQAAIDFFPEYRGKLDDPRKHQITLRHLLTMTAGLEWVENGPISKKWITSRDRVGFTWGSKLVATPGNEWNYSTALTHLLSGVITRATGTDTFAYARRTLLDPIGAEVNQWDQDPQGYYWGGSEVYMTPRNMAKFGYLYLRKGNWNGQQIVPEPWVQASTQQTNSAHYALLWWRDTFDGRAIFFAQGLGGQHIVVIPELDVVVVTTSYMPRHNSALGFIKLVLLPCIQRTGETQNDLPPASQIIDRYFEVIGGREKLGTLKSLWTTGSVDVEAMGISGTFELLKAGGRRIRSRVDWPIWPAEQFGSDGKVVWTTYPGGYRLLQGEQAKIWQLEARNWSDWRVLEKEIKTVGRVTFDGRPCYQLQMITDSREVLTDYFDVETGLLLGSIRGEEWHPHGLQAVTRIFREYRIFDGLRWPTKVLRHIQGPEAVFSREVIELDKLHFTAFELPIAVQEIVKGKRTNAR